MQVSVSVVVVSALLLLAPDGSCGPAAPERFVSLVRALLPWALHHRHAVRITAQVRVRLRRRVRTCVTLCVYVCACA